MFEKNYLLDKESNNKLQVGDRIRILRMNQKRTLQEIADACELSKSMISKIENNHTVPSIATLVKIASALGTNLASLLEQKYRAKERFCYQRKSRNQSYSNR
jgi:transcriptional regulator with XRE-family HTH domain